MINTPSTFNLITLYKKHNGKVCILWFLPLDTAWCQSRVMLTDENWTASSYLQLQKKKRTLCLKWNFLKQETSFVKASNSSFSVWSYFAFVNFPPLSPIKKITLHHNFSILVLLSVCFYETAQLRDSPVQSVDASILVKPCSKRWVKTLTNQNHPVSPLFSNEFSHVVCLL